MTLIVTIAFNVVGLAGTYLAAAMHRELPLTGWLDGIPWPRLPRRTRKENPCTTAAGTAATATIRTASGAPKAATTTSRSRRTSLLDTLTVPLRMRHATGQHSADVLTVRFSVGGERADGTWVHGGTGEQPRLDDTFPAGLRSAKGLVRP